MSPDPNVFAYDPSVPLDVRPVSTGRSGSARVETITYAGADGERVPAILSLPLDAGPDDRRPCVVLGHGLGGNKRSVAVFDQLARFGFAAFAIDARYHGERGDWRVLDALVHDPTLLERLLRMTVVDLRRGLDLLEGRPECGPIGYLGVSMGGFIGAMLAGVDERVRAPILLVTGADWVTMLESDLARDLRGTATEEQLAAAGAILDPIDPCHWIARVSPRPVLMINGDRDPLVPPASARALHAAARDPKTVVWYRGGHAIPSGAESERLLGTIGGWLLANLAHG
jgi:uncharacterized protein